MKALLACGRAARVLLVEDNDDDVALTRMGFEAATFEVELQHVGNGEACMAYLRRQGKYADAPAPDLVLLDLNMPRMDGREVLAAIAADLHLKHLPIVVLTTSDAAQDILDAYRLGCSSYLVKPMDFDQFRKMIQGIADYWFSLVTLAQASSKTG